MKKCILCILLFASCKTERAMFKPGDRVVNYRNGITFVIDSQVYRPNRNRNQVFYDGHTLDGKFSYWIPQRSLIGGKGK